MRKSTASTATHWQQIPSVIQNELRSSHAGELGAVWIYRGILLASQFNQVRAFARQHLATEKTHLALFEESIHLYRGSLLLPVWIVAGFLTGFIPALFGRKAVFKTIETVESFVEKHYQHQIQLLSQFPHLRALQGMLEFCQQDEIAHKQEASELAQESSGLILSTWCWLVSHGSKIAVSIAKRV
ncbi:demethoxyubiquinone hydroxylase family protein [Aliikangiella marina]|uniref:Demethoxyubiquinone hydroxylase family protein n=1 Tax=Aliikangiella marina TaxID=1712262 RepID=A0A545T508_9GAMM|nr:demethoxyubiquinone hydroxylase family protein [Aliikangiella marina]TQV72304.1 demethoxyubiquinone hydroxylase family protein [Aliikangiella marina]